MSYSIKIDLHMHTTVSDGTDTPEEIIGKVKEAGIKLFSVTDHDSFSGASLIRYAREKEDPQFINGIEFSCQNSRGKYHILGYGYDDQAVKMRELVEKAHDIRMQKVSARLDFLRDEFGFTFREEDIESLYRHKNPGKPHIALLMIEYGYASSIKDAMQNYLNKKKFHNIMINPQEAVQAILEGNGIPVLAHPFFGDGDQLILGDDMEQRLRYLLDFGLQGIECFYSGFTPKLIGESLDLADRYGLYVTAGSDYHGKNKIVQLGDTGLEENSRGLSRIYRFLEKNGISNL